MNDQHKEKTVPDEKSEKKKGPTDEERKTAARERYIAAGHAIQTGVALRLARDNTSGTSKHLRVGIDLRTVDQAALANLLITKGVITEVDYYEALAAQAEIEQAENELALGVKLV